MPCRFFRVVLGRGVLGAFPCGVWPRVVPEPEGSAGVFFDSGRVLFEPEVSAFFLPGESPFSFCSDDLRKHFPTDGRCPLLAFLVSCGGAAVSFSCGCRPRAVLEPEAPDGFFITVRRAVMRFFIRAAAGFRAAVL